MLLHLLMLAAVCPFGLTGEQCRSRASRFHTSNQRPNQFTLEKQGQAELLLQKTRQFLAQCNNCTNFDSNKLFDSIFDSGFEGRTKSSCSRSAKYRTQDGMCNNLFQGLLGSASTPFRRLLPPVYDDNLNSPRSKAVDGGNLASPRMISRTVHTTVSALDSTHTHLLMQWGQFLDHDITLTPVASASAGTPLDCISCDSPSAISPECFPIPIPPKDADLPNGGCMQFTRSAPGQITLGPREQTNQITSFIDSSNVYGSEDTIARGLRQFKGGLLRVNNVSPGYDLLPSKVNDSDCDAPSSTPCFDAGDFRNSEQPGLASLHTVWLREHNRIASKLSSLNPRWNDEKLYQETRRIIGALHQHITYNEYLKEIFGDSLLKDSSLEPAAFGHSNVYNPNCDASILNEFSTAAFRFGHSMIDGAFRLVQDLDKTSLPLEETFFNPSYLYGSQNIDKVLMGFVSQRSQKVDRFVSDSVRNHLLGSSLDLSALNIQRGRDHGLPSWMDYRAKFNLPVPASFADLTTIVGNDKDIIKSLQSVYKNVKDIDLYTGILIEKPSNGAMLGETGTEILIDQFKRLKNCDRFYYENGGQSGSFNSGQLSSIKTVRLSHVLCRELSLMNRMQPNAFRMPDSSNNQLRSCSTYPDIDLTPWKDASGPRRPPPRPSGRGRRPSPRRPPHRRSRSGARAPPTRGGRRLRHNT